MAGRASVIPKKPEEPGIALDDRIRQRAHEIYLARGEQGGSAMDDWLQAEAEIVQQSQVGRVPAEGGKGGARR